jgi:uncharacterized membrane protein YdjX (TVP38/TMEM64 family)
VTGANAPDPDGPPVEPESPWRAIALAALVVICFAVVYLTPLREYVDEIEHGVRPAWLDDLRVRADEAGFLGQLLFVFGSALGVSVGVPRLALAFVGGAVFGWIEGTILAQTGTWLGCWATFAVGRHLGYAWVESLVTRRFPRAKALLEFISRHGFEANVVLRLTPVGNAFATNLLFAVSTVRVSTFLAATFVGAFPETAIAALLGSAAKGTELAPRLLGGTIALVVLSVGAAWWIRYLKRGRG